jgi:hypothetical protein
MFGRETKTVTERKADRQKCRKREREVELKEGERERWGLRESKSGRDEKERERREVELKGTGKDCSRVLCMLLSAAVTAFAESE